MKRSVSSLLGIMLMIALAGPSGAATQPSAGLDVQSTNLDSLSSGNPTRAEQGVAEDFSTLAGSTENATRLVRALRDGTSAELTGTAPDGKPTTTVVDTATGPMGLGNVFISLALAQESLKSAGITSPTADQLNAALNGGTVTVNGKTIELTGVLVMRADGGGWGKIAQALGVKLGPVVSAIRSENGRLRAAAARDKGGERSAAAADGSHRAARAQQGGRAEHPEGAGRHERPARPERNH